MFIGSFWFTRLDRQARPGGFMRRFISYLGCAIGLILCAALTGCGGKSVSETGAPPPLQVQRAGDPNVFQVDRADRFPLTTAVERLTESQLRVTGTVTPDISRTVPVISMASGRVIEIRARLGDTVKKGQLLLRVQSSDISGAYSDYQKAVADEQLARTQQERAQILHDKGAISRNDLQIAEDTETKAKVDVATTTEKLRLLGNTNLDQPTGIVEIRAPVAGVITDQQVTAASGVQALTSTNPFTISDLSTVWIVCDVFENDLSSVRVGEKAEVRLNAYPSQAFSGTISNIGSLLDPNLRSVKVRIEVRNPGSMRPGMFVTATFRGQRQERHAAVPSPAILHLHDRDWVYVPLGGNQFRRVEVVGGQMIPGGMQEITSGIAPGQQVVANALELQNTVAQ
jgi:cobalt-zinc-cadmium efflux system membrane fusion protein